MPETGTSAATPKVEDLIPAPLLCSICTELMRNPYTISCGHSYCGECLLQWFKSTGRRSDKTCPHCRSQVHQAPVPTLHLRDLAVLTVERIKRKHPHVYEGLKTHLPRDGFPVDLFRDIQFQSQPLVIDDVLRCRFCLWELEEDGECYHCDRGEPLNEEQRDAMGLLSDDEDEEIDVYDSDDMDFIDPRTTSEIEAEETSNTLLAMLDGDDEDDLTNITGLRRIARDNSRSRNLQIGSSSESDSEGQVSALALGRPTPVVNLVSGSESDSVLDSGSASEIRASSMGRRAIQIDSDSESDEPINLGAGVGGSRQLHTRRNIVDDEADEDDSEYDSGVSDEHDSYDDGSGFVERDPHEDYDYSGEDHDFHDFNEYEDED